MEKKDAGGFAVFWRKVFGNIVYYVASAVVSFLLWLLMGYRMDIDPQIKKWKKEKKAFVILSAHPSELDAAPLMAAIFPRKARVVTGERQLYRPGLGWIFRAVGCIPKKQFMADMGSMRQMISTVKEGKILAMMPEGRVSFDSTPSPIEYSTAKFIKKLNVPVASFVNHGGYYVLPPYWHSGLIFGKINSEMRVILEEGEAAALSTDEIYGRIVTALDYNDSAFVKETGRQYGKKKNCMKGVSNLFYRCPVCRGYRTVFENGSGQVCCRECNTTWTPDKNMQLNCPVAGVPGNVAEWNAFQKEEEEKLWSDAEYRLTFPVKKAVLAKITDRDFEMHGEGTVTLSKEGFFYTDEEETVTIPLKEFTGVSSDYMNGMITVFRNDCTRRFYFDNSRGSAQFVNSLMAVRKLYL